MIFGYSDHMKEHGNGYQVVAFMDHQVVMDKKEYHQRQMSLVLVKEVFHGMMEKIKNYGYLVDQKIQDISMIFGHIQLMIKYGHGYLEIAHLMLKVIMGMKEGFHQIQYTLEDVNQLYHGLMK